MDSFPHLAGGTKNSPIVPNLSLSFLCKPVVHMCLHHRCNLRAKNPIGYHLEILLQAEEARKPQGFILLRYFPAVNRHEAALLMIVLNLKVFYIRDMIMVTVLL